MNRHPVQVLHPVFEFLDAVIRDHGDILFMVFVYAAIPFLVWVLCGGLRRKLLKGKAAGLCGVFATGDEDGHNLDATAAAIQSNKVSSRSPDSGPMARSNQHRFLMKYTLAFIPQLRSACGR